MQLYLVQAIVRTENSAEMKHRWEGTKADAATRRKSFYDEGANRKDIQIDQIDVPTDKAGLLNFLNDGKWKNNDPL